VSLALGTVIKSLNRGSFIYIIDTMMKVADELPAELEDLYGHIVSISNSRDPKEIEQVRYNLH
jgi:hypothetical protein